MRIEEIKGKVLPLVIPLGVKKVALFGSIARGEEDPESDVDILVKLKNPGERSPIGLKWFAVEEDLSRSLGRKVELVSDSALSPYVRPYVDKEMIILYEEE